MGERLLVHSISPLGDQFPHFALNLVILHKQYIIRTHIWIYVHKHSYMFVIRTNRLRTLAYTPTLTHTHTHRHSHIHIHTHIHTTYLLYVISSFILLNMSALFSTMYDFMLFFHIFVFFIIYSWFVCHFILITVTFYPFIFRKPPLSSSSMRILYLTMMTNVWQLEQDCKFY